MKRKRIKNDDIDLNPKPRKRRRKKKTRKINPTKSLVLNHLTKCIDEELKDLKENIINCDQKMRKETKENLKIKRRLKLNVTKSRTYIDTLNWLLMYVKEINIEIPKEKNDDSKYLYNYFENKSYNIGLTKRFLYKSSLSFIKRIVSNFHIKKKLNIKEDYVNWIVSKISNYKTNPERKNLEKHKERIGQQNYYPSRTDVLPPEIINEILKFLPLNKDTLNTIGLVNYRFHTWVLNSWKSLIVTNKNGIGNYRDIPKIVWFSCQCVKIDDRGWKFVKRIQKFIC